MLIIIIIIYFGFHMYKKVDIPEHNVTVVHAGLVPGIEMVWSSVFHHIVVKETNYALFPFNQIKLLFAILTMISVTQIIIDRISVICV